jgi:hypothetical protein
MAELPDETHERIQAFCRQGDALATTGKHSAALEQYLVAWDLLPEPQTEWEAATWILAAIGDANFLRGGLRRWPRQPDNGHALPRRYRQSVSALAAGPVPV